jgi:large subunit ribosomal protein L21
MYAIVKTGGKQYRVEKGQTLLVERLPEDEGARVSLQPLLYRSDEAVFDGADLEKVKVEATILAHTKGPKIRIVKFKPKRGYKRTTGHRQSLTRIEVTDIKMLTRTPAAAKAAQAQAGAAAGAEAPAVEKAPAPKKPAAPRKPAAEKKPAAAKKPAAPKKPATTRKPAAPKADAAEKEAEDGS